MKKNGKKRIYQLYYTTFVPRVGVTNHYRIVLLLIYY